MFLHNLNVAIKFDSKLNGKRIVEVLRLTNLFSKRQYNSLRPGCQERWTQTIHEIPQLLDKRGFLHLDRFCGPYELPEPGLITGIQMDLVRITARDVADRQRGHLGERTTSETYFFMFGLLLNEGKRRVMDGDREQTSVICIRVSV